MNPLRLPSKMIATLRDPARRRELLATLRSRDFLLEAAVIATVFFAAAGVTFIAATRMVVKSAESVSLEDLTGRDAGEAAIWLAARGLRAEIAHFEDNEQAEPLTVVFHEPPAGEELRDGMVVRLVISRGARSVPVPDVRGIYAGQARLILERNGLATGEAVAIHDASPLGTVLASSPAANAPVSAGAVIRLLTSKGPKPRAWVAPDVTWSLFDDVETLAASMGVEVEIGQRMRATDEPEGIVLEQFPPAGTRLVEGEPLRVTVNGDVGRPAVQGAATIAALSIQVPKGFAMKTLTIRITRAGWIRTLYEEPVFPGERVRVAAAVMPGDRAVATLDGKEVLVRTF